MSGVALICWQLALLLTTAAGWGWWIWVLARRPPPLRRHAWMWCWLAGFCAQPLVLQSLAYLGQPLARTAWAGLAVGLAGLWQAGRALVCARWPRCARREVALFAGVFLAVFAVQGWSLLRVGPARYFGNGHYDHANYVVTAQFLADERFSMTAEGIGLHPWLAHALETKEQRITQSVVNAALAVVSGTDCQTAYGVVSVFFIALAGAATAGWLRVCAAPRWAAALGGFGAALAPAITRMHLDGFFSQTAVLFVLPALAGVLWPRGEMRREARIAAALLLAFLVGAYTELAPIGVGLVVALVLVARAPWRQRLRDLSGILAGALLLNPGYALRLPLFLAEQWTRTRDSALLAALVPESGTWRGWGRMFLDRPSDAAVLAAGMAVAALMLLGLILQSPRRRLAWFAVLVAPLVALGALALQPELPRYPWAKLLVSFLPVWVALATRGVLWCARRSRRAAGLAIGAVSVGVVLSAATALPQHTRVIRSDGPLAVLGSPAMQTVRAAVAAHPERTWLVAADDPLVAQWLCYFGRGAAVYVDRRHLGDRVVPSEAYAFRRLPAAGELWWLDPIRSGVADYEPAVSLTVRGARETGGAGAGRYYLAGSELDLEFLRASGQAATRTVWLDFVLTPLAGARPCVVELVDATGRRQQATANGPGWLRFRVVLSKGRAVCSLHLRPASPLSPADGVAVLQSLSVESTASALANDPAPARDVP